MLLIKTLLKLLLIIVLVFAAGSLFAFPVFKICLIFSDQVRFEKVVTHTTSILALVILLIFMYFSRIFNRDSTGLHISRNSAGRQLLTGFLQGAGIIVVLAAVLLVTGIRYFDPTVSYGIWVTGQLLLKSLVTGLAVGILEELLYRGVLFGLVCGLSNTTMAVFYSSLVYAAVHYFNFPAITDSGNISWLTGIFLLPQSFDQLADPSILDSFLSLFAFGVLLALVRVQQGNIVQAIGIHAGVVMFLKINRFITEYNQGTGFSVWVNPGDHVLGYLAVIWLTILIVYFSFKHNGLNQIIRQNS